MNDTNHIPAVGMKHTLLGQGSPTMLPQFVGQRYVDMNTGAYYRSYRTSACTCWALEMIYGVTAPSTTPNFVGQQYTNSLTGELYSSIDTQSVANWVLVGSGTYGTFGASTISGLLAWWKSDAGITKDASNYVTTWADQSGNAQNLVNSSNVVWTDGLQNGYPGLLFNGGVLYKNPGVSQAQPATVYTVIKMLTIDGTQNIYASWGTGCLCNVESSNTWGCYAGTTMTGAAATSDTSIVTCIFSGVTSSVERNADGITYGNAGTGALGGQTTLGAYSGGGYNINGYIFELLVYSGFHSTTQRAIVKGYLNSKFLLY